VKKIRKSQIAQAYTPLQEEELDVFDKTMSPYITESNELMQGFLARLERMKMQNYYSVEILENLYNYTVDLKKS
jgi:hypothetical protein